MSSAKWRPFFLGLNVLNKNLTTIECVTAYIDIFKFGSIV